MTTNNPELAGLTTPVTDLTKAAPGQPATLQEVYERLAFSLLVDPHEPERPTGPWRNIPGVQDTLDEMQQLLDEHNSQINATSQQESTMAAQQGISTTISTDASALRAPVSGPKPADINGNVQTATETAKQWASAASPTSVVMRRSMMENTADAHNAMRSAVNAMTDLIQKMFGAEAAKAAAESYTGIGPMPTDAAGVAVVTEYMLRDISEMAQKMEAQARVLSGELG
jgi:hypothetical protein